MTRNSYTTFLRDKVGLSERAITYFQQRTNDFQAVGIDATACADARLCALPGFGGMNLTPLDAEEQAELDDPYIFHFPDGNAGLTRLMVRKLIPQGPGHTMQDVVLAKFDYSKLDLPEHKVQLRLGSTALQAKNVPLKDGKQEWTSLTSRRETAPGAGQAVHHGRLQHDDPLHGARDGGAPEGGAAPERQGAAGLHQGGDQELAILRQAGVHEVYSLRPYSRVKLDYPVNLGGYEHPKNRTNPCACTWSTCRPCRAAACRPASSPARGAP